MLNFAQVSLRKNLIHKLLRHSMRKMSIRNEAKKSKTLNSNSIFTSSLFHVLPSSIIHSAIANELILSCKKIVYPLFPFFIVLLRFYRKLTYFSSSTSELSVEHNRREAKVSSNLQMDSRWLSFSSSSTWREMLEIRLFIFSINYNSLPLYTEQRMVFNIECKKKASENRSDESSKCFLLFFSLDISLTLLRSRFLSSFTYYSTYFNMKCRRRARFFVLKLQSEAYEVKIAKNKRQTSLGELSLVKKIQKETAKVEHNENIVQKSIKLYVLTSRSWIYVVEAVYASEKEKITFFWARAERREWMNMS